MDGQRYTSKAPSAAAVAASMNLAAYDVVQDDGPNRNEELGDADMDIGPTSPMSMSVSPRSLGLRHTQHSHYGSKQTDTSESTINNNTIYPIPWGGVKEETTEDECRGSLAPQVAAMADPDICRIMPSLQSKIQKDCLESICRVQLRRLDASLLVKSRDDGKQQQQRYADVNGQRSLQARSTPAIAGSMNVATGNVLQGVGLGDTDMEVGPAVLQRMDSNYRSNKMKHCWTPATQQSVPTDFLIEQLWDSEHNGVDDEATHMPRPSTSASARSSSYEELSDVDDDATAECTTVSPRSGTRTLPDFFVMEDPQVADGLNDDGGRDAGEEEDQEEAAEEVLYEPPEKLARHGSGRGVGSRGRAPGGAVAGGNASGSVPECMFEEMYLTDERTFAWLAQRTQGGQNERQEDQECARATQGSAAVPSVEPGARASEEFYDEGDDGLDLASLIDDPSCKTFTWSGMQSFAGNREAFGPTTTGPTRTFATGYEAFRAIWTDDILSVVVEETNRYAAVVSPRGWYDTNAHEILLFFCVFIMLGVIKMPTWMSCFANDPLLQTDVFRALFSPRRFYLLSRCLHFVNNNGASEYAGNRKLFKLHPIIGHLNSKFQELYTPGQNVAIDESFILWKGNLRFKQFIRTKAAKFGMKSFELCDVATGYLWSFFIYAGKESMCSFQSRFPGCLNTTALVLGLIEPLLNKGYTLFMDDWFNSPLLARYLKRRRTDCVGTLRANRANVPSIFGRVTLKVGQHLGRHCGDVSIMAFQDKEKVVTVSTYHGARMARAPFCAAQRKVFKPAAMIDYNRSRGGLDKKVHKLEPYLMESSRMTKWYLKMFMRLLNVSIVNSRVLVEGSVNDCQKDPDFRLSLVTDILKHHRANMPVQPSVARSSAPTRDAFSNPDRLRPDGHYPRDSLRPDGTPLRKRCTWCLVKEHKVRQIQSVCGRCQIALCPVPCFELYHTTS